jgi:DNA-binding transcriptional ArsR family regulator
VTVYDLTSAQRRLLRYIALGNAAFPVKGPIDQFRTDYTISKQRLEEHLIRLEALGLVDLIEREDFEGRFDVEATREGHAWVRDSPG